MIGYSIVCIATVTAVLSNASETLLSKDYESIVQGVPPWRQHLYEPIDANSRKWACLNDSSILLEIDQINDGICDCPDGSDEPGTGACGASGPQFYCQNNLFIPRFISQSKVNDGVCDCCDCSDEVLAPAEPFYRGSNCSTLKNSFDELVANELQEYGKGAKALKRLYSDGKIETISVSTTKETLSEDVKTLSEELLKSEMRLNQVKAGYSEQLRSDNPLLYEYDQIDVQYIISTINSSFKDIIAISRAYERINEIMEGLQQSYSPSLNDRVVNSNMKRYRNLNNIQLSKLNCDSKIEEEQRKQFMEYFGEELPQMFIDGKTDKAPKYINGKITFVEALVLGKAEYTETVIKAAQQLNEIMADISENHNVNYQDSGVKHAVESYKGWLGTFNALKMVKLPEKLIQNLKELKGFIAENASKLLTSENNLESSITKMGFFQSIDFLMHEITNAFRPNLREQIKRGEADLLRLRNELEIKRTQYNRIVTEEENEKRSINSESLKQLRKLIEQTSPCVKGTIDNYSYEICIDGPIHQIENGQEGKVVRIGNAKGITFNRLRNIEKYAEELKMKYPDEDDLVTELISEGEEGQQVYLFGNLNEANNGLEIQYDGGDKCWNGPQRSATVFVQCSDVFELGKVSEITKCNYSIELKGPIGCNADFTYKPPSNI